MMKLSGMNGWFSEVTGYPERQVGEMARSLQKAGFIKTGQPGRYGGAMMDEKDAAALTVAVLAAERKRRVTGAVEAVRDFGGLRTSKAIHSTGDPGPAENPIPEVFGLSLDHTFLEFIGAAIRHEPTYPVLSSGHKVIGFDASITFPSLRVGSHLTLGGPRRQVRVEYGNADDLDELDSSREWTELTDQFRVTRAFDDKFFHGLHVRLFSENEYQARRRTGSDDGGADE